MARRPMARWNRRIVIPCATVNTTAIRAMTIAAGIASPATRKIAPQAITAAGRSGATPRAAVQCMPMNPQITSTMASVSRPSSSACR